MRSLHHPRLMSSSAEADIITMAGPTFMPMTIGGLS